MKDLSFSQALTQLKGYKIRTFLTSTRIVDGILLDVSDDHIVLQIEDKIFYFAFDQIHAVTKNAKNISPQNSFLPHESKRNLLDVLYEFKYSWITIQSINNQLFIGLLSKITEDYVMLLNEDDQSYIQRTFIVGIYNGVYSDKEKEKDSILSDSKTTMENQNIQEEAIQEKDNLEREEDIPRPLENELTSNQISNQEVIPQKEMVEQAENDSLPLENKQTHNQIPNEEVQEDNNMEREASDSLSLENRLPTHNKISKEEVIPQKDDVEQETNESIHLETNLSTHNPTLIENIVPENNIVDPEENNTAENSSFSKIINTLIPKFNFSRSRNDTFSLLSATQQGKETVPNKLDASEPKKEKLPPNIYSEAQYQSKNNFPPSIEKKQAEHSETKNYTSIPKMEMSPDYICHPLNEMGSFHSHNNKKDCNKKNNHTPEATKQGNTIQNNEKKLDPKEQNYLLEKQYYSLMKQAEYMYKKLRNERLNK